MRKCVNNDNSSMLGEGKIRGVGFGKEVKMEAMTSSRTAKPISRLLVRASTNTFQPATSSSIYNHGAKTAPKALGKSAAVPPLCLRRGRKILNPPPSRLPYADLHREPSPLALPLSGATGNFSSARTIHDQCPLLLAGVATDCIATAHGGAGSGEGIGKGEAEGEGGCRGSTG